MMAYFDVDNAYAIVTGPDGNLWVTTYDGLIKMTPSGERALIVPAAVGFGLTVGADSRIWFDCDGGVCAVTTAGVLTKYAIPAGIYVKALAADRDGNMWFAADSATQGFIGEILPDAQVRTFLLGDSNYPAALAADSEGTIWFSSNRTVNAVTRINRDGTMSVFSVCPGVCVGRPQAIARGADGALWLAFALTSSVARMSLNGVVSNVYQLPAQDLREITAGPDNKLWYATFNGQIGSISYNGVASPPIKITRGPAALKLTAGPDGNIWATIETITLQCFDPCPPVQPVPQFTVARVNLNPMTPHRRTARH